MENKKSIKLGSKEYSDLFIEPIMQLLSGNTHEMAESVLSDVSRLLSAARGRIIIDYTTVDLESLNYSRASMNKTNV